MLIRFRSSTKRENERLDKINKEREESRETVTPEQQIQASRVMGGIGAALLFGFFLTIAYSIYENGKTIAVKGTVVSVSSQTSVSNNSNQASSTTYGHFFQYTDLDGLEHRASDGGGRDSAYSRGDVVSIGYYPDDLTRVRIHSWFGLCKMQLVLLGLGLGLLWYMKIAIKQVREEHSQ